jgi:hypothetical protein
MSKLTHTERGENGLIGGFPKEKFAEGTARSSSAMDVYYLEELGEFHLHKANVV